MSSGQAAQQTVQETYLPNVEAYIQSGDGPRPVVSCIVCLERLIIIPNFQQPASAEEAETKYEEACVLPCEHVLGGSCWAQWSTRVLQTTVGLGPSCPVCRQHVFQTQAEADEARAVARQEEWLDHSESEEEDLMELDSEDEEEEEEEQSSEEDDEEPVSRAQLRPAVSTIPVLPDGVSGLSDDEEED